MNLISARKEIKITAFILFIALLLSILLPAVRAQDVLPAKDPAGISAIIPNPFSDQTTINYTLPDKIQSAYLTLTDSRGRVLKFVELQGGGNGQIEIKSFGLPVGVYYYSLVLNGRTIDTKQLVRIS